MTDASLPSPDCYHHSGRVSLPLLLPALLAASLMAAVLAAPYGMLGLYMHNIPAGKLIIAIMILGPVGFGWLLAQCTTVVLKKAKVRNTALASAAMVLVGLIALYSAWVFWIYAYALYCNQNVSPLDLAPPSVVFPLIAKLGNAGVWSIGKDQPAGAFLALIWGAESLTVLVASTYYLCRAMDAAVFCEHCQCWGTSRELAKLRPENPNAIQAALHTGDVSLLAALGPSRDSDFDWLTVTLEGCPHCDTLQVLTVTRTQVTTDAKTNKTTTTVSKLIERMVLTPDQILTLLPALATTTQSVAPETTAAETTAALPNATADASTYTPGSPTDQR